MGLEIEHTPAQGTVLWGTRRGDGAVAALRTAGLRRWRWSRQVGEHGGWYLPGTRDRVPPHQEIHRSAEVLRAAGFEVSIRIDARPRSMAAAEVDRAERLVERAQRLADRAERHRKAAQGRENTAGRILDGIPAGQPILVGHHSEARHRRDLDRADAHERAAREHDRAATDTARAADTAAGHMRHREDPQVVAGRLERLQAQRRRIQRDLDGSTRTRRRADGSVRRVEQHPPATGPSRERLLVEVAHLDEQIRHWTGVHETHRAAGRIGTVDWDQVHPGDLLEYRGRWEVVRRVNRTTVTVVVDPGWKDKITKRGVTAHRPASTQADGRESTGARAGRAAASGAAAPSRAVATPPVRPHRGGAPTAGPGP